MDVNTILVACEGATTGVVQLSTIVTADMINGVFTQIFGLLPIILPAMVSFIGVRKGISFLTGTLQSA